MADMTGIARALRTTRYDPERSIWYQGYLMNLLITGKETNGRFSIVETLGRQDYSLLPPKHVHHNEEESFYILEGEATFYLDGEPLQGTPGTLITLPRDVPHWFTLDSDEVRWLNIVTPAGFEDFFVELSVPAGALTLPPKQEGDLDIARLIDAAGRRGCEILPPG